MKSFCISQECIPFGYKDGEVISALAIYDSQTRPEQGHKLTEVSAANSRAVAIATDNYTSKIVAISLNRERVNGITSFCEDINVYIRTHTYTRIHTQLQRAVTRSRILLHRSSRALLAMQST